MSDTAELPRKVGDANGSGLADPVEDQCLALPCQHPGCDQYPAPGDVLVDTRGLPLECGRRDEACVMNRAEVNEFEQESTCESRASLLTLPAPCATIAP